jgi:hypothetical protein
MLREIPATIRVSVAAAIGVFVPAAKAFAQEAATSPLSLPVVGGPEQWTSPEGLTSAPAVLLMTTSFVRVIVVL